VNDEFAEPLPFRVEYSQRVRQRLEELARLAWKRGDGEAFISALQEFDRRLSLYPQFGDPLIDLKQEAGQIRIGIIHPLAMRYTVLDERRFVIVTALPVLMPQTKPHGTQ
jgi:hypothetical protein